MGCDITLHEEVKIEDEWHHYGAPDLPRDYKLYAKMAGVRNNFDIEPISEPKGLPDDLTFITEVSRSRYGPDAHDDSWLGPSEILQLYQWLEDEKGLGFPNFVEDEYFDFCFGSSFGDFEKYGVRGTSIPDVVQSVRFAFWFDN